MEGDRFEGSDPVIPGVEAQDLGGVFAGPGFVLRGHAIHDGGDGGTGDAEGIQRGELEQSRLAAVLIVERQ